MGNSKCKQSHSSVFENEEEEETWFEWMESTNERNQTSVTPRTCKGILAKASVARN